MNNIHYCKFKASNSVYYLSDVTEFMTPLEQKLNLPYFVLQNRRIKFLIYSNKLLLKVKKYL